MDSQTPNYRSKKSSRLKAFTIITTLINLVISVIIFFAAWNRYKNTLHLSVRIIIWMLMILNLTLFGVYVRLLKALWSHKIYCIKHSLEILVALFVLNVIPLVSKREELDVGVVDLNNANNELMTYYELSNKSMHYIYGDIWISSEILWISFIIEICLVCLYYNHILKCPQQNIFSVPSPNGNLLLPNQHYQMVTLPDTTLRSEP